MTGHSGSSYAAIIDQSNTNSANQAKTAKAWATAAYERLPQELLDIVYEHLWRANGLNHDEIRRYTTNTERIFITPKIVGSDFAKEATQWYFEHGCMGHPVALESLELVLGADIFGTGTIANACTLRSLCVSIDSTCAGTFGTTASFYNIDRQLRTLLNLKLIPDFTLTMRVVWDHQRYIDIRRLHELAPSLKSVTHSFKENGHRATLEYHIYPSSDVYGYWNHRPWAWERLSAPHASKARDFLFVQGAEANRMLDATSAEWAIYLEQHDALHGCVVVS